jgi:hypothetical protein
MKFKSVIGESDSVLLLHQEESQVSLLLDLIRFDSMISQVPVQI